MKKSKFLLSLMGMLFFGSLAHAEVIKPTDRVLVAYYSHSGNTAKIAHFIKNDSGADTFEIVPAVDYPSDYSALTAQAKQEIADGVKPTLKNKVPDLGGYDVIFVGSPCWWGTIAPPVATFLAENDFKGKTVVPFMTHGGSGLGHSVEDITKLIPGTEVAGAKAFWGSRAAGAEEDVAEWMKGLKND